MIYNLILGYVILSFIKSYFKDPLHMIIFRISMLYPIIILCVIHSTELRPGLLSSNYKYYGEFVGQAIIGIFLVWLTIDAMSQFKKFKSITEVIILKPLPIKSRMFLFLFLLIFSVLSYPHAFYIGTQSERFNLIHGASTIFLLLLTLIFSTQNLRNFKWLVIILLLFLGVRGERADVLVPIIFFYFRTEDRERNNIYLKHNIGILSLLLIGLFLLGALSFMLRTGGNPQEFLLNAILQNTLLDVTHVYLSSFLYVKEMGYSILPIANIFESFIPLMGGVKDSSNFTELLQNTLRNPGGGLAYSAFYISFGYLGFILYGFLYLKFFNIYKSYNHFSTPIYVMSCFLILRLNWYGVTYGIRLIELSILSVLAIYFYRQFILPRIRIL